MEYRMDELLPIAAKLTDKYTSKESSSVPYETARMLMEAVIYCMDECCEDSGNEQYPEGKELQYEKMYKRGYEFVVEKVYKSKKIYEQIIENFEDYGCRNYKDTITKGIAGFFYRYDPKFNPQDHILTLDYPTLFMNFNKCGVNLIFEYLTGVEIEKRFLDLFSRQAVVSLLERIQPEYKSIYLDNICYPVLLYAIGCMIVDRPVSDLEINKEDWREINLYFKDDTIEKIQLKMRNFIHVITDKMADKEAQSYLENISKEYAVRIGNTNKRECYPQRGQPKV